MRVLVAGSRVGPNGLQVGSGSLARDRKAIPGQRPLHIFDWVGLMGGFHIFVLVSYHRSPELTFVELCSIFQVGAIRNVRNGPGPNFGRKTAHNRQKLKSIFQFPNISPSELRSASAAG